jgi:hypothetical protein
MFKSTSFNTSRELARRFRQLADFLESRETFKTENGVYLSVYDGQLGINFDSKDAFVAAVKAIGNATKKYTAGDYPKLVVSADYAPIELSITRDKVCKKTITYDCEPLFSADEVAEL